MGPSFNGNSCKKLLEDLDELFRICPRDCRKYWKALKDFRDVVKPCFEKHLDPAFKIRIANFKLSYEDLNISVTPKTYAVFHYVPRFCGKYQSGLGIYTELPMESVHFDFKSIWKKHQVHSSHTKYKNHLLRAVCEYNGLHL